MGSQIKKQSIYNGKLDQIVWQQVYPNQQYYFDSPIVVISTDGSLMADQYIIQLEEYMSFQKQSHIYRQRASSFSQNLVAILSVEQLCHQINNLPKRSFLKVKTQRIPCRLSDTYNLNVQQGLYILEGACSGFNQLFMHYPNYYKVQPNMIGLNSNGRIRVWLNSSFAKNSKSNQILTLATAKIMFLSIVEAIENHLQGKAFPHHIKNTLFQANDLGSGLYFSSLLLNMNKQYKKQIGKKLIIKFKSSIHFKKQQQKSNFINNIENNLKQFIYGKKSNPGSAKVRPSSAHNNQTHQYSKTSRFSEFQANQQKCKLLNNNCSNAIDRPKSQVPHINIQQQQSSKFRKSRKKIFQNKISYQIHQPIFKITKQNMQKSAIWSSQQKKNNTKVDLKHSQIIYSNSQNQKKKSLINSSVSHHNNSSYNSIAKQHNKVKDQIYSNESKIKQNFLYKSRTIDHTPASQKYSYENINDLSKSFQTVKKNLYINQLTYPKQRISHPSYRNYVTINPNLSYRSFQKQPQHYYMDNLNNHFFEKLNHPHHNKSKRQLYLENKIRQRSQQKMIYQSQVKVVPSPFHLN